MLWGWEQNRIIELSSNHADRVTLYTLSHDVTYRVVGVLHLRQSLVQILEQHVFIEGAVVGLSVWKRGQNEARDQNEAPVGH